jgi:hypothetical protein
MNETSVRFPLATISTLFIARSPRNRSTQSKQQFQMFTRLIRKSIETGSQPLKHAESVDSVLQTSELSLGCDSYHEDSLESSPFLNNGQPQVRKWFHSPKFFFFDALLVMICGYIAFRGIHKHEPSHLDWQGDVTGFVPPFSHQIVTFRNHPEFISNHTSEASLIKAREFWKTLVPGEKSKYYS